MISLGGRLALYSVATSVICLAGFYWTDDLRMFSPDRVDFLSRFLTFQLSEARRTFREDGKPGLIDFFHQLDRHFPGQYALLDGKGRDVLNGEDRSLDVQNFHFPRAWRAGRQHMAMIWPSPDRQFYLSVEAIFPTGPPRPVPYYVWVLIAGLGFCIIPAVEIVRPLRRLSSAVEKFSAGNFQMRVPSDKRRRMNGGDEIGRLAQTFNRMADHVQTLLAAERRLLTDVSHELRSPLARLKFAVDLARTNRDHPAGLQRIEREVDRLTVLVSELLHLTRAEGEGRLLTVEPVSVPHLLDQVAEAVMPEAEARSCELQVSNRELTIYGDRELLYRAIENIVRNAIRFAPPKTAVNLSSQQCSDAFGLITVRDQGPGVPPEAVDSLFNPFFRIEPERDRQRAGFGLGLSIVERAVRLHGGIVRAFNAHPGLQVEIQIPIAASDSTPALPVANAVNALDNAMDR